MKILIIGHDAYLAQGIEKALTATQVDTTLRFDPSQKETYRQYDTIINYTLQPEFLKQDLPESELIDVQIAKALQGSRTKLVMMSSRKVYGAHEKADVIKETDPLDPQDFYAKNKVKAENGVREALPGQHLIVRIANILGEPVNRTGYKTFIGWISESFLANGHLTVTEHPSVKKDFITRNYVQYALSRLIQNNASGTINLGAGFALSLEQLLSAMCGKENITFTGNTPPRDQFILDTHELQKHVPAFTKQELKDRCETNKTLLMNFLKMKEDHVNGRG